MKRFPVALCLGFLLSPAALAQSGAAEEVPYSRNGADTCLGCHGENESLVALFRNPHGAPSDPRSPFGAGQLQCEACHGPGGLHAGRVRRGEERPLPQVRFGSGSGTPIDVQNGMCLGCHEGDAGPAWHASAHNDNEIACADCHRSHVAQDPVLQTATQDEVCYQCHTRQRSQALRPYAHPVADGKMACTGCHAPHGDATDGLLLRQTLNDTCFECHAEKRGPYLWEHAPVVEDCSNCHEPHGSIHPGMLSARAPLLCQSCHSQAGHPSVAYTTGGLPEGSPSPYLLGQSCLNCHSQVHGSNHPSGSKLMR